MGKISCIKKPWQETQPLPTSGVNMTTNAWLNIGIMDLALSCCTTVCAWVKPIRCPMRNSINSPGKTKTWSLRWPGLSQRPFLKLFITAGMNETQPQLVLWKTRLSFFQKRLSFFQSFFPHTNSNDCVKPLIGSALSTITCQFMCLPTATWSASQHESQNHSPA